jgi:hypothetical protein
LRHGILDHTPSLPGTDPRSDRFQCGGRESKSCSWLFIGAADAGERAAILYTIVENCRRRGINPHAYLRDVLTRLPMMKTGQIPEITPEAWAKAQKQRSEPKAAA